MTASALTPEEQPVVVRDVHPATVTLPDGTEHRRARAVLTRERLYLYVEQSRVPALAWSAPYAREGLVLPPAGASKGKAWRVPTDDGLVLVQPVGGCGCGSSLKLWQPFRPMRKGSL